MTCSVTVYSQQYYRIEVGKLDTLFFYAQKGKICDTTIKTQLEAITALQISDREKGELIVLKDARLKNYAILDENWSLRLQNQGDLFQIEKSTLRQKVKKRNKLIIGMAGTIAVLVAVILGG